MCPRAEQILLVPFLIFCLHVPPFKNSQELAPILSLLSQARGGARELICISASNPCSLARLVQVSSLHRRGERGLRKAKKFNKGDPAGEWRSP